MKREEDGAAGVVWVSGKIWGWDLGVLLPIYALPPIGWETMLGLIAGLDLSRPAVNKEVGINDL